MRPVATHAVLKASLKTSCIPVSTLVRLKLVKTGTVHVHPQPQGSMHCALEGFNDFWAVGRNIANEELFPPLAPSGPPPLWIPCSMQPAQLDLQQPIIFLSFQGNSYCGSKVTMIPYMFGRAINAHVAPSMGAAPAAFFAAPRQPSGHASAGNERRIVAGISSFAFQVLISIEVLRFISLKGFCKEYHLLHFDKFQSLWKNNSGRVQGIIWKGSEYHLEGLRCILFPQNKVLIYPAEASGI